MAPVDTMVQQQGMMPVLSGHGNQNHALPGPPMGAGTISLSTLIEYILQRTYQELTILSELLPRKTDMERKIEIVQFASRTRQLFVRLLALVKWANSASKVDKCALISSFLDQQAMLFVDTADLLARMSRETLIHARLPSFSLPCAIDVLTTGTYPRLPACIKERIVPPDPITVEEKRETLSRLDQIIEHRLVTADLPRHMRRPTIANGRVKFIVPHEFMITLTLMGDGVKIPWRLLDIDFLVEDPDTGDGKALVHSLQVMYIHELVQSRLMDNDRPLHDLYNCLHSFCQSLQLEVLFSQTQRLKEQRLSENIRIEEYLAGRSLVISYWREPWAKNNKSFPTLYKLSIHVDDHEPDKPLQISHFPHIQGSASIKVAMALKSDQLSMEKLLVHTIQMRSLAILEDLKREFKLLVPGPCEVRDLPTVLYVTVVEPCMDSEKLCLTVNMMTGSVLVSVDCHSTEVTNKIQECLNSDRKGLRKLLSEFRLWLGTRRCEHSMQLLQVTSQSTLPLVNLGGHPLEDLGTNVLFVKFPKEAEYYLVVRILETKSKGLDYKFFSLQTTAVSHEQVVDGMGATLSSDVSVPSVTGLTHPLPVHKSTAYLKAGHLMQLDAFACTQGPWAPLFDLEEKELDMLNRKRKLLFGDPSEPAMKRPRGSPYFVSPLVHVLASFEDKIPFIALGNELQNRGLPHQGIQLEAQGAGLALPLLQTPKCPDLNEKSNERMLSDLLSVKFRVQRKGARAWLVEVAFANCPVQSSTPREQGPVHRLYLCYDVQSPDPYPKIIQNFIDDWNALAHLYQAVLEFSEVLKENNNFQGALEIKSHNYKRITMAYGPDKCYSATVQYMTAEKQFRVALGTIGPAPVSNCHTLTLTHLQKDLNASGSLAGLAQTLIDTWSPLTAIGKITVAPQTTTISSVQKPGQSMPGCAILPQSSRHVRLVFRGLFCLDLHLLSSHVVGIRDGAYSVFDTSKVVDGLLPIPGFKTFLNFYMDDTAKQVQRRSTTEDDNPPSPMGMDSIDSFMAHSTAAVHSPAPLRSIKQQQQDASKMHNPMTPPSNPCTPASPRICQPLPSPAGSNFPLASPPSLQQVITPSPSNVMAPSPGNLPVPSPSFAPTPSPSSLGMQLQSPANTFISPQGMLDGGGSPYPMVGSAGHSRWPASPSLPGPSPASRSHTGGPASHSPGNLHPALHSPQKEAGVLSPPSRVLPQRSWAASIPTQLSHDAMHKMFSPAPPPTGSNLLAEQPLATPIERFLGCVFFLRNFKRILSAMDNLSLVPCTEQSVMQFKGESLQHRVFINPTHYQTLHLTCTPLDAFASQWDSEELQYLDKYFEAKVASGFFKVNILTGFSRLLGAPFRLLKDFVQIMRLELVPEANLKWHVQWCLTVPHGISPIAGGNASPAGTIAVVMKAKILFILQLTRNTALGGEPQTIIAPILYDKSNNQTQMMDAWSNNSQAEVAISQMFQRFAEFNSNPASCSIYPAIRELLSNLTF